MPEGYIDLEHDDHGDGDLFKKLESDIITAMGKLRERKRQASHGSNGGLQGSSKTKL